jgi:hypothetical protein
LLALADPRDKPEDDGVCGGGGYSSLPFRIVDAVESSGRSFLVVILGLVPRFYRDVPGHDFSSDRAYANCQKTQASPPVGIISLRVGSNLPSG